MRASTPATTPATTPRPTPAAQAALGQDTGRTARAELPDTRTPETTTVLAGGMRRGAAPSLTAEDKPGLRRILKLLIQCYVLLYLFFIILATSSHFISL